MIRMLPRHGWQDWRTPGEAMAPERTGAMMQQMCMRERIPVATGMPKGRMCLNRTGVRKFFHNGRMAVNVISMIVMRFHDGSVAMTIGYRKFLCLFASGLTLRYNFLFSDPCGHCGCNRHVRVHFVIFAALQHLVTCNRSKQGFLPEGCMPIYEYRCTDCGHAQEHLQKMSDAPIAACPHCGGGAYAKQLSPTGGFSLKGGGYYATDFKNKGASCPAAQANGGGCGGCG